MNRLICGNAITSASASSSTTKNGAEPRKISSIRTSGGSEAFMANTTMPNGGVSRPSSIVTIAIMPNQILS